MKKGQEEAPIELLIGVSILTFVLIIGFYAYQNICVSQYEQSMKASISKFARDLELVYLGSVETVQITQVDFSIPMACGGNVESIKMLKGNPGTCRAQTGKDDCLALIVVTSEDPSTGTKGILVSEVLDIPAGISIFNNLDLGKGICGLDMNRDITWSDWDKDTHPECWFGPQQYTIKIKKESVNKIVLSGVV